MLPVARPLTLIWPALEGLAVVRDRHDLALVLLAEETVHRAAFAIYLDRGNSAARLAQALIIARHAEDAAAEAAALTKLDQRGDELDPGTRNPYRVVVGYWAAVYRPLVPVDLSDVAAKRPSCPSTHADLLPLLAIHMLGVAYRKLGCTLNVA